MKTRIASFIVTGIVTSLLFASAGCGGGGLSGTDNKLTGQWVAEKLNAKGDRILLIFNETSIATPPVDETPYNPYDKPSKTDPHSIRIMAIRSGGDSLNVDAGGYSVDKNKINFDLTTMSDFASPFTITEPSSSAPGQLTLGTDLYYKVTGDLNGPQLGGQIQISQSSPDEGVTVSSVHSASVGGIHSGDKIPGEILVKFKNEDAVSDLGASPSPAALTVSSVSARLAPKISNSFVKAAVKKAGYTKITIDSLSAMFGDASSLSVASVSGTAAPKTLSEMSFSKIETDERNTDQLLDDTRKVIEEYQNDPTVEYAVFNSIVKVQSLAAPTDTLYDQQWNLKAMNASDAWGVAVANKKITVAVIDTGIVDHPDLVGQVDKAEGYDFVHDSLSAAGATPISDLDLDSAPGPDNDPTDPGDQESSLGLPGGSSWHGTHISGIIAGVTDNAVGIAGIAGTAGSVQILPVRAMGYQGNGTLDDVAQAIYYAAKLKNIADCATGTPVNDGVAAGSYAIDETSAAWTTCDPTTKTRPKADIINLSLGALLDPMSATPLNDAVNAASGAGVLIVAAAGNEASGPKKCTNASNVQVDCFFYPAANPNVLSIGGVYANLSFANSYSNYGGDGSANNQFLVAPGGSGSGTIMSTVNPSVFGGYAGLTGTSQAAAHVSGVAALVWSDTPTLTVAQVKEALRLSAIDLGDPGLDKYYGNGLVNACGALLKGRELAGAPTPLAGSLKLSSSNVDFGSLGTTHTVVISGGCGTVSGITGSKHVDNGGNTWLGVTLTSGTSPSQMTFTIDRAGLAPGDYTATVTVNSSSGSQPITIKMTVGAASTSSGSEVDNLRKEIEGFLSGGGSGYTNASDVGEMIIMLIDANTGTTAYYTKTDFTANYNFQFGGLNPGSYYILAGVDTNQDGTICKDGETEPCLAYPSFAEPQPVEVTATTKQNDLVLVY